MRKKEVEKTRVNVTISVELYQQLKERADLLGTSVPSVLVNYAVQGMQQEKAINTMNSVMSALNDVKEVK